MSLRAAIARTAAVLVLISQALAIWVVVQPSGRSAIAFSFIGHPAVAGGVVLGIVALAMRRAGR